MRTHGIGLEANIYPLDTAQKPSIARKTAQSIARHVQEDRVSEPRYVQSAQCTVNRHKTSAFVRAQRVCVLARNTCSAESHVHNSLAFI